MLKQTQAAADANRDDTLLRHHHFRYQDMRNSKPTTDTCQLPTAEELFQRWWDLKPGD